jgi:hypothetical protein
MISGPSLKWTRAETEALRDRVDVELEQRDRRRPRALAEQ